MAQTGNSGTNSDLTALDLVVPPRQTLPEHLQRYFDKCEEKLGLVPNVLTAYSHNPGQLEAFSRFYNELMLGDGGLSPLEREMIAVAVSAVNRCYYCLTAHGAAVREYSGNPELGEQLMMNYRVADLGPRQRAMLDFAVHLTEHPDRVGEAERQQLRDAGFSDAEIWDIASLTGFYNMTNRLAGAVEMQPNSEYHARHRGRHGT
ncbi:alkyl hydroperoxide reductase AhpD [Marinobacterium nitratireducens]|uniref:Alkyl hydroperoxide reductase AhpD n=1 Tax=Marinobacterium nitratireducens TaxID=518897 RepID=A0A917ZDA0_9GAMM|nr:peroxidase-related enzyme [Marinobacterium nitratireducens]GGO81303.1 alkyl hydroperoxide reductase AhpD [Marinobacterium nitratireducens]